MRHQGGAMILSKSNGMPTTAMTTYHPVGERERNQRQKHVADAPHRPRKRDDKPSMSDARIND